MAGDSVTLRFDGILSVGDFATAAGKFAGLLDELRREADALETVDWMLTGLEFGSALVTGSAVPRSDDAAHLVPGLVSRYVETAREFSRNPAALTRPALRLVHDIAQLAASDDREVVFETAEDEVVIVPPTAKPVRPTPPERVFGTVRGRVSTLQQRHGLRFVLYDELNDKAVTCYLQQGAEQQMRDAWGQLAEVTGLVTRDPISDRPLSVREVVDVRVVKEPHRFGFKRARGAVQPADDAQPAEHVIRRMRDAI